MTGSAVRSMAETGMPVRIELPKSPWTARSTYCPNCTGSGRSSPYSARMAASASGERSSPASASAGSPGSARMPRKTTTDANTRVSADCHARVSRYLATGAYLANPAKAARMTPSGNTWTPLTLLENAVRLGCR